MRILISGQDSPEGETTIAVGLRLRAAREARQISLRDIAATTKISIGALEALEENNVRELPGGIFTRAFVRAYAAEVGLDPEETTRDFVAQATADEVDEEETSEPRGHEHDLFRSQQRMAGTVLKLALVAAPVAGLLLFLGTRGIGTDAPESPPAAVETAPPSARIERVVTAPPSVREGLTIALRPREDCWISLTLDGASEPVVLRTMRAGESVVFEADDEINLIVGNPSAFAFTINQQVGKSFATGDPITLNITRQNYRNFVAP